MDGGFSRYILLRRFMPVSVMVLVSFFIFYTVHPIDSDWLLASSPYKNIEGTEFLFSPLKD